MKRLSYGLSAVLLGILIALIGPVEAAQAKKSVKAHVASVKANKPAKSAKAVVAKKGRSPHAKVIAVAKPVSNCSIKKEKTARGWRKRKVCGSAPEATLKSPIEGDALEKQPTELRGNEIKARTVPDRAYAVDGATFFYLGRKYRVAGLHADSSDMAKQRLQKALESGSLMVDPISTDEAGVSMATVRVNGRELIEQMR